MAVKLKSDAERVQDLHDTCVRCKANPMITPRCYKCDVRTMLNLEASRVQAERLNKYYTQGV